MIESKTRKAACHAYRIRYEGFSSRRSDDV